MTTTRATNSQKGVSTGFESMKSGYDAAAPPLPPTDTDDGGVLGPPSSKVPSLKKKGSANSVSSAGSSRGSATRTKSNDKKSPRARNKKDELGDYVDASETAEEQLEKEKQNEESKKQLQLIRESFSEAMKDPKDRSAGLRGGMASSNGQQNGQQSEGSFEQAKMSSAAAAEQTETKKTGWSMFGSSKAKEAEATAAGKQGASSSKANSSGVPQDFDGMARFNAGMNGASMPYIEVMLRYFGGIVQDVVTTGKFEEQTDFLAMVLRKEVAGKLQLGQFKLVLLSSMSALIPGMWNAKYEQAWTWFWASLEELTQQSLLQVDKHSRPVVKYAQGLQQMDFDFLGNIVWRRLFESVPEAELQFKQSFSTFVRIATLALQMTPRCFEEPARTKEEIERLGLQHIMHRVKPQWFLKFANIMEEEVKFHSKDDAVARGIGWTITAVGSYMGRIVEQGSNPVLLAALTNNVKDLRKALGEQPRGSRAKAALYL